MTTQAEKVDVFRKLHESGEAFVIPNPWDAGSARLLQGLGFQALATTSAGFAQTLGRMDGDVSLEEKLSHCKAVVSVTDIPVSADFENGFADSPEEVANNLVWAAETGIAGASIEDFSGTDIYDFELAVARIQACSEAKTRMKTDFLLTGRAENLLRGVNDLDDTIRRLQAYEAAGADVLYAPGLNSLEQIQQVMAEITKPMNVLTAFLPNIRVDEFSAIGVARLSIGSALANNAIGATISAANAMLGAQADSGSFAWMSAAAPGGQIKRLLS
ncbi:MAG: 2-methylisocitrate lyase-like PEP mutase family enzyme [Candidatus Azotimanducaceae bacterium]